jgi:hypothetical protein
MASNGGRSPCSGFPNCPRNPTTVTLDSQWTRLKLDSCSHLQYSLFQQSLNRRLSGPRSSNALPGFELRLSSSWSVTILSELFHLLLLPVYFVKYIPVFTPPPRSLLLLSHSLRPQDINVITVSYTSYKQINIRCRYLQCLSLAVEYPNGTRSSKCYNGVLNKLLLMV